MTKHVGDGVANLTSLGQGPREMKYFDVDMIKKNSNQKIHNDDKMYFETIVYLTNMPNKVYYYGCSND